MRIRAVAAAGAPRAWEVAAPPGTRVGALAAVTGLPRADYYALDGHVVAASTTLEHAGAADGALLGPADRTPSPARIAVVVIDGPDTGQLYLLAAGHHAIGRHPSVTVRLSDASVGGLHAELHVGADGSVQVRDRGHGAGTWLGATPVAAPTAVAGGAVVRVGATRLRVEPLDRITRPARAGDEPANRPPRVLPPPVPAPPPPPAAVDEPSRSANIRNLLTMLVPSLAGAGLMAAVRPEMLALSVLAPVGALASWLALRALDARAGARARAERARRTLAHAALLDAHRALLEAHRRARHPDLGEVLCRVRRQDPRLWERRRAHDDFLRMSIGIGDLAADDGTGELHAVPVDVDASAPVGIVGPREAALALARALVVQTAVHHGPADVTIAVWTTDPLAWGWVRWLPHGRPNVEVLTTEREIAEQVARWRAARRGPRPFVVVDALGMPSTWRHAWRVPPDHHPSPAGAVPAGVGAVDVAPAGMVLAAERRTLPEQCATVISLRDRGDRADDGRRYEALVAPDGAADTITIHRPHLLGPHPAEAAAAGLAARRDPDLARGERALPDTSALVDLVSFDPAQDATLDRDTVLARWSASKADGRVAAPIGVDTSGPLVLDLVADGPHGLLAGTTGSGKSELLRSLVVSFATTVDPEHLAFVLVDYKGGSAFDGLAALPHVVDVVTDLDATAATRAVQGLEAEVHRRERALRAAGATDVAAYHHSRRTDPELAPVPRLAIVVDEFATLAHELPAFVDALVDVAQRGRSLGVHLLLATQRPAGAVKDAIRTNTNLRIALRVLDTADSRDVLGSDDAATIERGRFGRAVIRLGAGELRPFQAAYVSGATPPVATDRPLVIAPFGVPLAGDQDVGRSDADGDGDGAIARDLDRIVRIVRAAHDLAGCTSPVRPWTDSLPCDVPLCALDATGPAVSMRTGLPFALLDDARTQQHVVGRWMPSEGHLLVAGMAGSGTTNALAALLSTTLDAAPSEQPDVYVITMAHAVFAPFAALSHVGAILATDDDERVRRLLGMLCARIDARRRATTDDPFRVLLLVDGIGALRACYDSLAGMETLDQLDRIAAEGPSANVHVAFAAEHPNAVGHRIDRTIAHRVLLRLGDRHEYAAAGVRDLDPSTLAPGAGIEVHSGRRLQVAHACGAELERRIAQVASRGIARPPAPRVRTLPSSFDAGQLAPACAQDGIVSLPLGIGDAELDQVALHLHAGEHAMVVGPARSGKSNALAVARHVVEAAGLRVLVIGAPRSRAPGALSERAEIVRAIDALLAAPGGGAPIVVLVDDADVVDDGGALERLVAARHADVRIVAAARGDRLRPLFRHWTNEVRRSGSAVLLRPDDGDADLVGVRVPRTHGPMPPGRAWLVHDGDVELAQLARVAAPGPSADGAS